MTRTVSPTASAKLETSYLLLLDGMEQLNVGVSIYDNDLLLVACNRQFRQIFGLPDEMVRSGAPLAPVLRLLAERGAYGEVEVEPFVQQSVERLRAMDEPLLFERCVASGRHFQSNTSRLPSGGFITVYTDVTHHKQAEAKLIESAQTLSEKSAELELILRNASLGILTVVPEGPGRRVMRRVNLALERLLGYEHGELEGRGTRILYPNDDEYDRVSAGYTDIVLRGQTYHGEHVFVRKDGQTIIGILRGSALNPQDPGRGAIWLIEDITERKRIEAELAAKSALLRAGIENMPGAMVIWDSELRYILWSPRTEHYFNLPSGTLKVGLPLLTMARYFAERGDFGPGDIDEQIEMQMRPFYRRESMVIERNMPDGTVLEVRRNPLPDGGYVSVFQDISERKSMERALLQAKEDAEEAAETIRRKGEQVAALLNSSGQGFLSFGSDLVIDSEYSQACVAMLGQAPAGKDISLLLFADDPDNAQLVREIVPRILDQEDAFERAFMLFQLPQEIECGDKHLIAEFRVLENGHLMVVLTDVTHEKRLKRLSVTDRLTGLFNRRKLDEVLDHEFERARRTGLPVSVIIADIDHFKEVNDRYGHLVGDQVLVETAEILQSSVRKVDTVGRWGGEEFMIICPDTGIDGATEVAEKIRQCFVRRQFSQVGPQTCSLGVAEHLLSETIEATVRRADAALYRAKHGGRNRVDAAA